ncbi:FecCD family ABC transporter permease [Paenibacillus sacheonensis]|uniref:Iron chelate uptake ABC transporter family permease subunit n=1 Tax=Paenibacillus sacheonensis TaxID=742054 RepID=A0A7X5BZ46_9BACL|nr:iron ABC transporter permease [Paenibacillus sacheonensis]MBM7565121.1 iron complex transport system permease protein [Paenibacillus sacheonensis]NBC70096.1 iron chelate uptake ABC transporter family permease subunit [Paenibacillus sacheonensis]
MRNLKFTSILMLLFILTAAVVIACVAIGSTYIPIGKVAQTLLGFGDEQSSLIIVKLRLPRILMAVLVGASLAAAGAILQGLVRNPLTSPDLVGISGGATVASVLFLTFSAGHLSIQWVPLFAILGAFITAAINYAAAWRKGISPLRFVLIGISLATAMGALTTFALKIGPPYMAGQALGWMTGTLYGTAWMHVWALLPWAAVLLFAAIYLSRFLNALELGDELAVGIGTRVQRMRLLLLLLSVGLTGAAIGMAGGIGFIGLMAPHIARRIIGPKYGRLIPASAFIGALLLLLADLAGRTAFLPSDIPAGVFTAAIGAPFFLYLLLFKRTGARA